MDEQRDAIKAFLKRHGWSWHRKRDDCGGCIRFGALQLLAASKGDFAERAALAEFIVSEEFSIEDAGNPSPETQGGK